MRIVAAFAVSLVLAGCAGREFARPQNESLNLGKTTYEEVVATYGSPRRTGSVTKNGVPVKTITYAHAVAVPFTTKLATRAMVFSFQDDVLVGYDYASSFEEDKGVNDIGDEKVKQLKKGDDRSRVIALFGRPGGEFMFPLADKKGTTLVRYTYLDTYRIPFGGSRVTRKTLAVLLDSNGIVTDITSSESQPN